MRRYNCGMRTFALVVPFALATLAAQEAKPAAAPPVTPVAVASDPILTVGDHSYRWDSAWAKAALASDLGNTHGCVVVDAAGELLANTDTEQAVMVFGTDGHVARSWGKDYHGGLHGMLLRKEDGKEVLYLAHTRRHEVLKTTLAGEVLWTIGWPEASGIYQNENEFNPTAIAVAADGRIYIADGYGKSWIHVYDRDRKYLKSFGGPGQEPGKLRTPHGIWLDARGDEPLLLVCDRENSRLQWFSLDGEYRRLMDQGLRRPCNVWPWGDRGLVVADLAGRISFLDAKDHVIGHLGDNPDPALRAQNHVAKDKWRDGEFLSPHSVCVDAQGAIYVMDWNSLGRLTRLAPVAAAPNSGSPKER